MFFISHVPSIGFYSAFLFSCCFGLLPAGFYIAQFSVQTPGFDLNSYWPLDDELDHELILTELLNASLEPWPSPTSTLSADTKNPLFSLSPSAVFMVLPDSDAEQDLSSSEETLV